MPTITTTSTVPDGVTLTDNGNGTASLTGTPAPNTGRLPHDDYRHQRCGAPVNEAFVLTVYQVPVITSVASDTVTAGEAMTPFAVTDTGYPAPMLRSSGLPSGLKLVGGTIEGTPKTRRRDVPGHDHGDELAGTATQNFELTVTP